MHAAERYWQTLQLDSTLRSEAPGKSITCVVHDRPVMVHFALTVRGGAKFVKSVANDGQSCARHFTFPETGGYAIMDDVRVGTTECVVTLFASAP